MAKKTTKNVKKDKPKKSKEQLKREQKQAEREAQNKLYAIIIVGVVGTLAFLGWLTPANINRVIIWSWLPITGYLVYKFKIYHSLRDSIKEWLGKGKPQTEERVQPETKNTEGVTDSEEDSNDPYQGKVKIFEDRESLEEEKLKSSNPFPGGRWFKN